MKVKILRQKSPAAEPFWESFDYEGDKDVSIAGMLDQINYSDDIINDQGERTERIAWDCSCLQGVCGACAMVINEVPALACETFLRDLSDDEVVIRPLRKFPVVKDLIVDRSVISENLKMDNVYIGEYNPEDSDGYLHQYKAAKCLKCGLCLEVCPNYTDGSSFYGALFANDCYLVSARNSEKSKDMKKTYAKHFGNTCYKSMSCMKVCPMNIPTITSMAKLNR